MQGSIEDVHVAAVTERYIVDLVQATRADHRVALGASPRGTLALLKLARARAALERRDFVLPDDVKAMAVPALSHRLVLKPELWAARVSAAPRRVAGLLGAACGRPPGRRDERPDDGPHDVARPVPPGGGRCALSLGVLSGAAGALRRRAPALAGAPSLALRAPRPRIHRDHARVSRDRVFEGERVTVSVTVAAGAPSRWSSSWGRCPPGGVVADRPSPRGDGPPGPAGPPSGATTSASRPAACTISARSPSGCAIASAFAPGSAPRRRPSPCGCTRASRPFGASPSPLTRGHRSATTSRPRSAKASSPAISVTSPPATDPTGELARLLRLGTLYVTQHQRERNADVVLMLDTLAEVGPPPGRRSISASAPPLRWRPRTSRERTASASSTMAG